MRAFLVVVACWGAWLAVACWALVQLGGVVLADLDVPGLDDAYAQAARERDERERPA